MGITIIISYCAYHFTFKHKRLMKYIISLLVVAVLATTTSCSTPKHGCNYSYAKKKNAKTLKKMHRYNKRHARY